MMFHVLGIAFACVFDLGEAHIRIKFCGHAKKSQHIIDTDTWFWVSVPAGVQLGKSLHHDATIGVFSGTAIDEVVV